MKIQRTAAVTMLAACLAAGLSLTGCANSGGGGDGSTAGDGQVGSSGGKVPRDARRVSEATGSRLIHRPLREGTIYVTDADSNKVLYSGPVRANANVVVDPAANAITVNDQQVKSGARLETGRTYRLYFLAKHK